MVLVPLEHEGFSISCIVQLARGGTGGKSEFLGRSCRSSILVESLVLASIHQWIGLRENVTGKPHVEWENRQFPVKILP